MAKRMAGRGPVFDGSRIRKINWRRVISVAVQAASQLQEFKENGATPSKLAAAIARWQKARDAVDEGILADEQARVNQQ